MSSCGNQSDFHKSYFARAKIDKLQPALQGNAAPGLVNIDTLFNVFWPPLIRPLLGRPCLMYFVFGGPKEAASFEAPRKNQKAFRNPFPNQPSRL